MQNEAVVVFYDRAGRQTTEYTVLNGVTSSLRVNTYNELGQLREQITDHVTERFDYNLQGWQTAHTANHARAGAEDVFSSSLHYYDPEHGTTPSYSGNITQWNWQQRDGVAESYNFDYDEMGRLDGTIHRDQIPGSINRFTERAQYDLNGNIVSLSRTSDGATSDLMFYHYAGGRLASVDGLAPATFEHDEAGNMTANGYDDLEIQYNLLNLPSQITDSGAPDDTVTNRYAVTGQKVSSVDGDGNGVLYVGSLVYGVRPGAIALESVPFSGGRFFAVQGATGVKYALQYYVTDHLGSVRVVLDRDGNVLEQNDYYPFGKRWEDAGSPNSTNRYRYNGKEVAASRLLDYGARYYSPGLGRWMSIDPLVELDPSVSGYAYVGNNPIRYIDPYGLWQLDSSIPINNFDNANDFFNYLKEEADYTPFKWDTSVLTSFYGRDISGDGGAPGGGGGTGGYATFFSDGDQANAAYDYYVQNTEWEWGMAIYEYGGITFYVIYTSFQPTELNSPNLRGRMRDGKITGVIDSFGFSFDAKTDDIHNHRITPNPSSSDIIFRDSLRQYNPNVRYWIYFMKELYPY